VIEELNLSQWRQWDKARRAWTLKMSIGIEHIEGFACFDVLTTRRNEAKQD
jgi:hypothetical protein